MMSVFCCDEFWWNNITGPHMVVTKVVDALLDNNMIILVVPEDLPWRNSMRSSVQAAFRDRSHVNDVLIDQIDAVDDNPDGLEPGRLILSLCATSLISQGYRERSRFSIQDYIVEKNVIQNRIIWVQGLKGTVVEEWVKFCRGFGHRSLDSGLFVLEVNGEIQQRDIRPLIRIDYEECVSNYDVQLFNSFILDDQDKYTDIWKKYIATVTAEVCGTDAEISAELLQSHDFREQSVIEGIDAVAASPKFKFRGREENSGHVLWYYRNNMIEELERRVWSSQLQVFFPIIEMERLKLIEKLHDEIQETLDNNLIMQFNEPIQEAIDVEWGCLCYMLTHKSNKDDLYMLYIKDDQERDLIFFLRDLRNKLAHSSCCTNEEVARLLDTLFPSQ